VVGAETGSQSTTISYDQQGEPVRRRNLVTTVSYDYSSRGDLVRSTDSSGETVAYDYDRSGSLLGFASRAGTAAFGYAAGRRLVTARAPDGSTTELAYDAFGRVAGIAPEAGDEVLVGFEHGDTQHPVVVGFLWPDEESVSVNTHGRLLACTRCP
jgi:YD repeat-containing protein